MKTLFICFSLSLPAVSQAEFRPLFDGRDLTGWSAVPENAAAGMDPQGLITVHDGTIHMYRDADLAGLCGVATMAFNQAIKRNAGRFPQDFLFQLTSEEWANLRPQTLTSSLKNTDRSPSVTGSHGGRRTHPFAFTEHDDALRVIWRELQPLLAPPPTSPKREIGFHQP